MNSCLDGEARIESHDGSDQYMLLIVIVLVVDLVYHSSLIYGFEVHQKSRLQLVIRSRAMRSFVLRN